MTNLALDYLDSYMATQQAAYEASQKRRIGKFKRDD